MADSIATMVKYWDRLLPEMKAKGWDITKLASEMKISFQAVAKVRDGGSFGSTNNLKAAKLFDLNPEWLATGKGPKSSIATHSEVPTFRRWTDEEVSKAYAAINYEKNNIRPAIEHLAKAISLMEPNGRSGLIPLLTALTMGPDSNEIVGAIASFIENAPAKARQEEKQKTPAENERASRAA